MLSPKGGGRPEPDQGETNPSSDHWWNPAVEDQASDRAYRIGQKRTVQVRKFVCVGTLEERIDKMIEQKKALANAIIGTGKGWLTELDTDQLAELFKLSQDAVSE